MTTWGWVMLWIVLIIGAGVFYAFIGLRLYRKFTHALAQAGEAANVAGAVGQAVEESEFVAFQPGVDILAPSHKRREWRMIRRLNRVKRRQRKVIRRTKTLQRWQDIPYTYDEGIN